MSISNDVLSSTLYSIRDGEVDELFKKVAFLANAKAKGGIEYENGGSYIHRPLSVNEHSTITQFSTGYEPVSLAVNSVLASAVYDWADFAQPIVISRKEELENSGEKAVVKILEARMRSVMGQLRRELNKQILAGNSTVLTRVNTLNGVSSTTGFLEDRAVGAQTNTVGGVSKTVYQSTTGWQNQFRSAAGAFGTNGKTAMDRIWIGANSVAHMGEIDSIIMSEAGMSNYKRILFSQERYIDEKTLDGGRMALAFAGAMVEQDLDMPANAGVGVDEITAYFLNFDGIKLIMHRDSDFEVTPFENIPGSAARQALLHVKCQLVADHLGSQGILVNGDTF